MAVAGRLATQMGITNFRKSNGWLWQFCNQRGLCKVPKHGKTIDADAASVKVFRQKLQKVIEDKGLVWSQMYSLMLMKQVVFGHSLPKHSHMRKEEDSTQGKKFSKQCISVLMGANATGTHRLKLTVMGKYETPQSMRGLDYDQDLPVIYYNTANACFNSAIVTHWFFHYFVPAVKKYQTEVLKIPTSKVRAILLLDNTTAHPDAEQLATDDNHIRAMYLPPNTTQPQLSSLWNRALLVP